MRNPTYPVGILFFFSQHIKKKHPDDFRLPWYAYKPGFPPKNTPDALEMDTHTQLDKLNKEIDAIVILIAKKEEKREKTDDVDEKAFLRDSIKGLYSDRSVLIASREHLLRNPSPAPSLGKNAPSRPRRQCPPSTREHAKPPARCRVPLFVDTIQTLFEPRFKPCVEPRGCVFVRGVSRRRARRVELCLFCVCAVRYAADAPPRCTCV